jgi:hypothetical protein
MENMWPNWTCMQLLNAICDHPWMQELEVESSGKLSEAMLNLLDPNISRKSVVASAAIKKTKVAPTKKVSDERKIMNTTRQNTKEA